MAVGCALCIVVDSCRWIVKNVVSVRLTFVMVFRAYGNGTVGVHIYILAGLPGFARIVTAK